MKNQSSMPPKTPETRARELFKMIFHYEPSKEDIDGDWIRLGRMVLDLEQKWTEAKRQKKDGVLVQLHPRVRRILSKLVSTGLFGPSVENAAERMICDSLRNCDLIDWRKVR